jgi:hypothetical protein
MRNKKKGESDSLSSFNNFTIEDNQLVVVWQNFHPILKKSNDFFKQTPCSFCLRLYGDTAGHSCPLVLMGLAALSTSFDEK